MPLRGTTDDENPVLLPLSRKRERGPGGEGCGPPTGIFEGGQC